MIEIQVDYKDVVRTLTDIGERQIPFALAKSINDTVVGSSDRRLSTGFQAEQAARSGLVTVQGEERLQLRKAFEIRQTLWADRAVKVTHFAKKSELWATIGIHPPGSVGDARADVLTKFEADTSKVPKGDGTIAVPISPKVKRLKGGTIRKADRPRSFHFRQVGKALRGDRGTFLVRNADGTGIILQRTRRGLEPLYLLVHRVEITPDLHFVDVAMRTVDRVWALNMERAFQLAIETAK